MGLRTLALILGVMSLFATQLSLALGLGEIKLNSHLNQPLEAEVDLVSVRDLTENEILISLASAEEFSRAGVERPFFLLDLKFKVDVSDPSGPVIRIKSQKSVLEPYLSFIIKLQWPSGKLLREYTVLMDLPIFVEEPTRKVQAPSRAQPANQRVIRETTRTRQPSSSGGAGAEQGASDGVYTVSSNDTLWTIASRSRPSADTNIQQTMMAIKELNPNAFINGNINLLKKGAVLRLPKRDDISLSSRQAINEIRNQSDNKKQRDQDGPQLDGSATQRVVTQGASTERGVVKLSSSDTSDSKDGRGTGDGGDVSALRTQLQNTEEELGTSQRENDELKSQITAMDEQIETLEKLIEVNNEELKMLELAIEKSNQLEQPQAAEPSEPLGSNTPVVLEEPSETQEQSTSSAAVPVKPYVGAPKKSMIDQVVDTVTDYLYYIIGGLVTVFAIALFFIMRRDSDMDDFEEFDEVNDSAFDEDRADSVPHSSAANNTLQTNMVDDSDVLSEADIHIAYSNFDSAEELLLDVIAEEPENESYKLKLLEVYSKTNNNESFNLHYGQLSSFGSPDALERANTLRGYMDVPQEDGPEISLEDLAAELSEFDQEDSFDLDLESDKPSQEISAAAQPEPAVATDEDLNSTMPGVETASMDIGLPDSDSDSLNDSDSPNDNDSSDNKLSLDDDLDLSDSLAELDHSLASEDSDTTVLMSMPSESSSDVDPTGGAVVSESEIAGELAGDLSSSLEEEFSLEDDLMLGELQVSEPEGLDLSAIEEVESEGLAVEPEAIEDELLASDLGDFDLDSVELELDTVSDEASNASSEPIEFETEGLESDDLSLDLSEESLSEEFELGSTGIDNDLSLIADDAQGTANDLDLGPEFEGLELAASDVSPVTDLSELNTSLETAPTDESDLDIVEDDELSGDYSSPSDFSEARTQVVPAITDEMFMEAAKEPAAADGLGLGDDLEDPLSEQALEADAFDSSDLDLQSLDEELDQLASEFDGDINASVVAAGLDIGSVDASLELDLNAVEEPIVEEPVEESSLSVPSISEVTSIAKGVTLEDDLLSLDGSSADLELGDAVIEVGTDKFDELSDVDSVGDEVGEQDDLATKLDLLKVYVDMGDSDSAMDTLEDIMEQGDELHKKEAERIAAQLDQI